MGMTSAFAGSDKVVTRWKYHAIGSVRANWMMAEPITSSAGEQNRRRAQGYEIREAFAYDLGQFRPNQSKV